MRIAVKTKHNPGGIHNFIKNKIQKLDSIKINTEFEKEVNKANSWFDDENITKGLTPRNFKESKDLLTKSFSTENSNVAAKREIIDVNEQLRKDFSDQDDDFFNTDESILKIDLNEDLTEENVISHHLQQDFKNINLRPSNNNRDRSRDNSSIKSINKSSLEGDDTTENI